MFLVLMVHYIPSRMTPSPDSIRADFWNTMGQLELKSICFVCVNCFVLISGYFSIRWKTKSFSKLIYSILFWAIVALVVSKLLLRYFEQSEDLYFGNFLSAAYTARWFIGAYLCLYILAPIVNSFIDKCSTQQLGRYIVVFYIFSTIYGWLMLSDNFNEGMSELSLIGLYATGAYLKRTNLKIFSYKCSTDIAIFFGLTLILSILNATTYFIGIDKSLHGYLNPIIILESIYLFLFFKKLKTGYIPWVNFIAASTFSAYLFHHHQYIFPFYTRIGVMLNENSPSALLTMTLVIFTIFLFCAIVDLAGNKLFDAGFKLITKSHQRKEIAQTEKL